MSLIALESHYLIERIKSIAFQVGHYVGDDSAYNRQKQAEQIVAVLDGSGLSECSILVQDTLVNGIQHVLKIESTHFYEMLRFSRQFFTQQVLNAIQLESNRPRASYLVLRRRVLDVEAVIEEGVFKIDFSLEKEKYPLRLSYRIETQGFLLNEWLKWFDTDKDEAITTSGDFKEVVKVQIRGRYLCFLKFFHQYRNERPIFWTYNRLHVQRDALIDQFHLDVDNGYVSAYQPQLWKKDRFERIQQFLRRPGTPEKIYCPIGRQTFVLDASLSERDIFISQQVGKSERIQGVLNKDGLSLRSSEHFLDIQTLLKRLDVQPVEALMQIGKESQLCTVCNRKLDSEQSIAIGMGPVCAQRLQVMSAVPSVKRQVSLPVQQTLFD